MDVSTFLATVNGAKSAMHMLIGLGLAIYLWPENKNIPDLPPCDFVIVGAGTAGSVLANRLTEFPWFNVCVIEAGGDPTVESRVPSMFAFLPKTDLDWQFTSEDDGYSAQYHRNKYLDLVSGKGLGGSSTINHLLHVRGDPTDYDDWVKATGDESWSWNNLLPYFTKSESVKDPYIMNSETGKYHGTDGYMGITKENRELPMKYLKAYEEMGHNAVEDTNGRDTLGFSRPMFIISDGVRQSTAESFLSPIKDRPNLYIIKNTLVTKIIFNANKEATGVECTGSDGNTYTVNAKREVIISAGAFNSPKLLMLSGIGPRDHLNSLNISVLSDLPVGKNLQDHTAVLLAHTTETTDEVPKAKDPHVFPLEIFTGFGAINKTQKYPDYMTINLIARNLPAGLIQLCSVVFGLHDDVCNQIASNGANKEVVFTVKSVGRPTCHGEVLLRSDNPTDSPKIFTRNLCSSAEIDKYVAGIEDINRVTESSYYKKVGGKVMHINLPNCSGFEENSKDYWRCYVLNMMDSSFHFGGTCAMGTVLDSSLRVQGVSNLRVADASSMPNLCSGNIMAAVLAIAEKAADLIKRDNGST